MTSNYDYCPECGWENEQEIMERIDCMNYDEITYYCHHCGEEYTVKLLKDKVSHETPEV